MFIELYQGKLAPLLKRLLGVVESRQTLPILGNVLVRVEDGQLTMTTSDTELQATTTLLLDGMGIEEGATTIPAKKLSEIVRSLSDSQPIQILQEGNQVKIKSGKSRFKLSTLPADYFPTAPEIDSNIIFTVDASSLRTMLGRVKFAMAVRDVRYYLNGMLFEIQNGKLGFVAADGYRLAYSEMVADVTVDELTQALIPLKAIGWLFNNLPQEGDVKISLDNNHVRFAFGDMVLDSKLIDGRFPDYHKVMPCNTNRVVEVDVAQLKAALNRVAILSNEKYKVVRLVLTSGLLALSANNPDQEEAEEELAVVYDGDPMEIGFNMTYVLDVLGVIEVDVAVLNFGDGTSPVLINPIDSELTKYVVMPVRL